MPRRKRVLDARTGAPSAQAVIPLFAVHIPADVDKPILEVLHSGYIGQGPKVEEFERLLAEFLETKDVITVNSGTSAIHLALRLANIQSGDEVISTPMTCSATNEPILAAGAIPVWADIDPENGLIDPLDVERKITPKTKAIVCVDWGGTVCDLDELMRIGTKYNLKVIEDAAHAFGAEYKGKKVGTIADFTCFSFQAIKQLTTVDGGMLTTKEGLDYKRGKLLRWYGIDREATTKDSRIDVDIPEYGYKFHMNDVAATIGIVQMKHINDILQKHRDHADYYKNHLNNSYFSPQKTSWPQNSSYWLYTITLPSPEEREEFTRFMSENRVMVSRVHARNDIYTAFLPYQKNLPGVTSFSQRHISIPVHWKITQNEMEKISKLCADFAFRHAKITITAPKEMSKAFVRPVVDLADAMEMRKIRNECASFMTHDTSIITVARQKKLYFGGYTAAAKQGTMTCYLITLADSQKPIGYGVVRLKDGKYWLTGGLLAKYRGQGYGQFLFSELIRLTPDNEVWLDVLETNEVGRHIYNKLGFKEVGTEKNNSGKKLIVMKTDKGR